MNSLDPVDALAQFRSLHADVLDLATQPAESLSRRQFDRISQAFQRASEQLSKLRVRNPPQAVQPAADELAKVRNEVGSLDTLSSPG